MLVLLATAFFLVHTGPTSAYSCLSIYHSDWEGPKGSFPECSRGGLTTGDVGFPCASSSLTADMSGTFVVFAFAVCCVTARSQRTAGRTPWCSGFTCVTSRSDFHNCERHGRSPTGRQMLLGLRIQAGPRSHELWRKELRFFFFFSN